MTKKILAFSLLTAIFLISCNEGTAGAAQFGVWTSCAAIGTYGAGFLGCQVGSAPLSISPLTPGQTYYIAVDGFAGDVCAWNFTGTGIILPIKYAEFNAFHDGEKVLINWSTASENNNDFFTIERTIDGLEYENIGRVDGAGNSTTLIDYSFTDSDPYVGLSYYRIKQTDFDGKFKYSDIKSVSNFLNNKGLLLVPNPTDEDVIINFKLKKSGDYQVKIVDYSGSVIFENTIHAEKGNVSRKIDLNELKNGLYSIIVTTNDNTFIERFTKY